MAFISSNRVDQTISDKFINTPKPINHYSQEVRNDVTVVNDSSTFGDSVEDFEVALDLFIDLHDGSDVTASVAVVRCRPDSNEVRVLKPEFKSIHDKLMGTSDQVKPVNVVEF